MKRISVYKIMGLMVVLAFMVVACTKENPNVKLDTQLTTAQVKNVTSESATVMGFVIAEGDGITERGVCYSTQTNPTVEDNKVVYNDELEEAAFMVTITGLNYVTTYYVRAYVITAGEVLYGEEFNFTTLPILPTVTTAAVSDITETSAKSGGEVLTNGGAEISARGVCYSLDSMPTIDSSLFTTDGTGLGVFVSEMTELMDDTTYYVRAYATNSAGTAYGEVLSFETPEIVILTRTWYVPGDYVAASYPESGMNDWDPATSPFIQSLETSSDNLEGYVYMANASNQWKLATQPNWDGPNYGGADGILDPAGDNIASPAGYYKINVDAATLTYTAVATEWGVIGSATPLGWDDETALTYDPYTKTWRGGVHLTAEEFKFRANHDWAYNYGSTAGDETLNDGGDNIPVATEADYYITLDLSNPNAYTYSANYWGLIGSATPGGWDADQDMTWDAVNQSLTLTVDLIVGEIKFRANDDWAINYGGTPEALEQDGPNIQITEEGNYTIHLYLAGPVPTCTIEKN